MIDFYICHEMQKLRDELNKRGIKWQDDSSEGVAWICSTHFMHKGYSWSVIHGYGTYGGVCEDGSDVGGLECMCVGINGSEPFGYLSADDVLRYMDGLENPERKCKTCKYLAQVNVSNIFICSNPESDYVADLMDKGDWCGWWEGVGK